MTGLELLKAPGTTAGEIVDIIAEHCPPVVPTECDRLSCRECWISWLITGEPPRGDIDSDQPNHVDLVPLRRLCKAELSGDDPYKPWDKQKDRHDLNKGNDPLHLE